MHDKASAHISKLGTVAQLVNFQSLLNMSRRKQPCPQQVQGKVMPTTIDSEKPDVYFDVGMNTCEQMSAGNQNSAVATKVESENLRRFNTLQSRHREMVSIEERTTGSEQKTTGNEMKFCDENEMNSSALPENEIKVANSEEPQKRVLEAVDEAVSCTKELYFENGMEVMDIDKEPTEEMKSFVPRYTTPPCGDENNHVQHSAYEVQSKTEHEVLDDSDRPLCIEEEIEDDPAFNEANTPFVKYHSNENSPHSTSSSMGAGSKHVVHYPTPKMFPSPVLIPEVQHPDVMAEKESPVIDSKNSEIQLLKEQVKMIQQQHQYQIQMIHYLQLQMSMLTQQRQQSEEAKPQPPLVTPGGTTFNPLTQLLANTNKFGGAPDLASSVASALSEKLPLSDIAPSARQSSISPPSMRGLNAAESRQHPMSSENGIPLVDQGELMMRALHQQRMQQNPFLIAQQQARQPTLLPQQVSAMLQARERLPGSFDEQNQSYQEEHRQSDARSFVSKSPPMQNSFAPNSTNKLQRLVDNIGDDQVLVKNQCKTCRRVLSCPSALKLHYRTHTGERPYQCDLCSRAFTTRGNLRTHYSSVHRRELPPANISNNCTTLVRRNQASQPPPAPPVNKLTCPLCSDVFDDQLVLTQHMQMHALASRQQQHMLAIQQQQEKQQRHKSDISPMNSPPSNTYKQNGSHVVDLSYERRASENNRSPNLDSDPKIKQEQTSPTSETKTNDTRFGDKAPFNALDLSRASPQEKEMAPTLENHEKTTYSPSFNEEYRSTMHQITPLKPIDEAPENADASRTFSCDLCPASFDYDEDLKDHLLRHENSLCDSPRSNNSGSSYSGVPRDGAEEQQRYLKRAYEEGNSAGEPDLKRSNLRHWCDICRKQFSSASSLQIHNRTHTGEKPFSCNVCGRSFTTKGNLKVHMGTHVWGAGGSRRGRRVSMDNPVMSSWMKNSTNVDTLPGRNGSQPPSTSPNASAATAAIYQQYAALAQGLMNRSQEPGQMRYPASNAMLNLNPAALAASRILQQQQQIQAPGSTITEASPEGRTETSLSSDGENDQIEASVNNPSATAAHEWLWKVYQQRTQGQVN